MTDRFCDDFRDVTEIVFRGKDGDTVREVGDTRDEIEHIGLYLSLVFYGHIFFLSVVVEEYLGIGLDTNGFC